MKDYRKWAIIAVVLIVAGILGYMFIKANGSNIWFCTTHNIPCTIARLQTTAIELKGVAK